MSSSNNLPISQKEQPPVPTLTADGLLKFPVDGLPYEVKQYNGVAGFDLAWRSQHWIHKFDPKQSKDHRIPFTTDDVPRRLNILNTVRKELGDLDAFTLGKVISKNLADKNFVIGPNLQPPTNMKYINLVIRVKQMRDMWVKNCVALFELMYVEIIRVYSDLAWKEEVVNQFMKKYGLAYEHGIGHGLTRTKKTLFSNHPGRV